MRDRMVKEAKRVVVKVGSSVIATPGKGVDRSVLLNIVRDLVSLKEEGRDIVLVSSGAIACGTEYLGLDKRPESIALKQAVAALGQPILMEIYKEMFGSFGVKVAQILLSKDDLIGSRRRFINIRNTFSALRSIGAVPVVNENDSVVVEEIKFGDNDNLSSYVAGVVEADLLVILSDIDGIFADDPKKNPELSPIREMKVNDDIFTKIKGSTLSFYGSGGVRSKLEAAERAARFGIPTVIANGRKSGVLVDIMRGEPVGTFIYPKKKVKGKKIWIGFYSRPKGKLYVDDGAKEALLYRGKSLLPSGVVRVDGEFKRGDCVLVCDLKGCEFARGLVNYSSEEIRKIMGKSTSKLSEILGYSYRDEIIHRDDMYLDESFIPTTS